MKINYLSEAFKPISVLKANADKQTSQDEFRNSIVKDRIESMLNDKKFIDYTTACCAQFIRPSDAYYFSAEITFKYINVEDDVINVTAALYYPACNATKASIYPVKDVYLMDNAIRKYTVEEIHKRIDDYITNGFEAYAKKYEPDLLNIATRIHVQRIYLWGNTVEGDNEPAGNLYPLLINLQSETTFGGTSVLDDKRLSETFDKVNDIFTFCVKKLMLCKESAAIVPIKAYSVKYILNNLINKDNVNGDENDLKVYNNMYDDLLSPAMRVYMLSRETLYIDLNDYIKTRHIDDNLDKSKNISTSSIYIFTKTPLSKLNTIKNDIINAVYTRDDIECLKDIAFFAKVYKNNCRNPHFDSCDIMLYRYGKFDGSCSLIYKIDI